MAITCSSCIPERSALALALLLAACGGRAGVDSGVADVGVADGGPADASDDAWAGLDAARADAFVASDAALGDATALDATAGAALELGTGDPFRPFASGDRLEIVAGPQGGYHFLLSTRWSNADDVGEERFEVRVSSMTREIAFVRFRRPGAVSGEATDLPIVLDIASRSEVVDQRLTVDVRMVRGTVEARAAISLLAVRAP